MQVFSLQHAMTVVGPAFVNRCVECGESAIDPHFKTVLQK
jgi:hypothetical protein